MPLIAVLVLFFFVVIVNAPLHRWWPRYALSSGELAVIVLMSFMGCSLTNWGIMRFFIPIPVVPFHLGATDETFWKAFTGMDLPKWLFPVEDVKSGRTSEVARWFYTHVPEDQKIPYGAWTRVLLGWGVFIAAMFATLVAMARLLYEQWAYNERLPFPIVQVQAALLEAPPPGKALNNIFRSNVFWIGLGGVFFIHMLSCLNTYFPKNFPKIPLGFDLSGIFADPPLFYMNPKLKAATLSFIVVGVTYFIRSRVAFSLWVCYFAVNVVNVQHAALHGEMPSAAWQDQHLGASFAFVVGIFWIGRHHWLRILKSAFGMVRDPACAIAFWIAILGTVVMIAWLRFVGVQIWEAAMIVLFILTAHLVVARVVAETGLPFYRSGIAVSQVNSLLPTSAFSMRDVFFSLVYTILGPLTTRDSATTFAMQGMGIAHGAGEKRKLGGVIAWALVVGFIVGAYATLYCQYSYPTPQQADQVPARNYFGAEYIPKRELANPMDDFSRGKFTARQFDWKLHMGIGVSVTAFLQFATWRWASWPILPVGYIVSFGAFIGNAWFSIMIGWLAQLIVVRLGGATLFQKARPFFIGIIFGEALAAGLWIILNAIIVLNGGESQAVKFLL
jgi:hypothetical protein